MDSWNCEDPEKVTRYSSHMRKKKCWEFGDVYAMYTFPNYWEMVSYLSNNRFVCRATLKGTRSTNLPITSTLTLLVILWINSNKWCSINKWCKCQMTWSEQLKLKMVHIKEIHFLKDHYIYYIKKCCLDLLVFLKCCFIQSFQCIHIGKIWQDIHCAKWRIAQFRVACNNIKVRRN